MYPRAIKGSTYHWTFTPDDANHESSSGTVEVTVTGHEWDKPTYEWAEDDTSCTAKRVCANNAAHVEEETVVPACKVTAEPTTENEGKAVLTAEFQNAAFGTQSKEVTLPKLPKPGKMGSSVTMEGDGPTVEMSMPDGLLESLLTDEERELVAGGTDALLVATVRWLGTDEVSEDDLALLAKDCEDRKMPMGWETYLDIHLSLRVGDAERRVTRTDKPIAFKIKLDPKGRDAVSKEFAQAIADGKADGSVTVRRVHEAAVDEVGSAKRSEAVTFESDRFSTYAIGSRRKMCWKQWTIETAPLRRLQTEPRRWPHLPETRPLKPFQISLAPPSLYLQPSLCQSWSWLYAGWISSTGSAQQPTSALDFMGNTVTRRTGHLLNRWHLVL